MSSGSAGGTGAGATGGSQSTSGVDNGSLFADAAVITPTGAGGSSTDGSAPSGDTGPVGPPGDGNSATLTMGTLGLTAVFTQTGIDVTMVLTATNCPQGNHTIRFHNGFACDDPTNGPVWDTMRGDGIGGPMSTFTCDAARKAMMTYTRLGADPTTNWTVGDHNETTDLTRHPIKVDATCGTFF